MHISFHSKHLRDICEIESYANDVLGSQLSSKLIKRLFDINASKNVWELPVGNPVTSFQDGEEYIIVALNSIISMGFVCVHAQPPKKPDNSIDWDMVRRIKLMFIGDEK